jgi:putative colanic acid biosynthesis glycosyltransferase
MNNTSHSSFGISVITVTLNQIDNLKSTIVSIQDFANHNANVQIENVIIDGNSNDGTKEFLNNQKYPYLIYLSEKDNGIYDAMNKGVKIARFDYVVFINAGDSIELITLENSLVQLFKIGTTEDRLAGFAFSVIYKLGICVRRVTARQVERSNPKMPGIHQGMLYKRNRLLDMPFDESFEICGDYEQYARMFSNGYHFIPIDEFFSTLYAGGISTNKPYKLYLESNYVTNKYFKLGRLYNLKCKMKLLMSLTSVQLILLYSNIFSSINLVLNKNMHQNDYD